jgi:peptidoglycan/LPS O-acetylase OafA/YrhL
MTIEPKRIYRKPGLSERKPTLTRRLSWRRQVVTQAGERRSASIESLRALAALSVLAFHVFYVDTQHHARRLSLGDQVGLSGRYGVFFFFAISGYLLFRPFVESHLADGADVSLRRYARNRALRILPLYYVVLLVLFLGSSGVIPASEALRYGLFLENYSTHTIYRVDTPMWSLVVEVQFYVLLPLIGLGLARWGAGRPKRWLAALAAIGLASYASRWLLVYLQPYSVTQLEWTASLPTNFMFFIPGMLLAVLASQREWLSSWRERRVAGSGSVWTAVAVAAWALAVLLWPNQRAFEAAVLVVSFLILGACSLELERSRALGFLRLRPLALIGVISYSIYLWHENFVLLLAPHLGSPLLGTAVLVPLCLAWAAVSYLVIERPFLRQRRPAPAATPLAESPAAGALPGGVVPARAAAGHRAPAQ